MGSQQSRIDTAVQLALRGATVITANTRASRSLRLAAEWAALQDKSVCETPDILPLEAWVNRTWTECLLAGRVERALLKPNVVQALWETTVADSEAGSRLLSHTAAGALAGDAWRLIHDYKLPRGRSHYLATAESTAFFGWAQAFETRCQREGWIDSAAALQELIATAERIPKLPNQIVIFGFDQFTPLQQELWKTFHASGVDLVVLSPEAGRRCEHARVTSFADAAEEIRAAGLWARGKLEKDPGTRIGILIPGLARRRDSIETVLTECLHPEFRMLPGVRTGKCFDISLGRALSEHPMMRTALRLLRLVTAGLSMAELSALLRSPYLEGGTSEASGRALLDFEIRESLRAMVTLPQLCGAVNGKMLSLAPQAIRMLNGLERAARKLPRPCTRSEWAAEARRLLTKAGWPGDSANELTLTSEEFQVTNAWDGLLSGFGALDQVLASRSPADIQSELERAANETTFAVENEAAPIQVVGPLAAAGESYDALWFCGLTDEAWPQRGHPNSLIPYALQREADAPHAAPEWNARNAEQVMARVFQSAEECILSWPRREEDRDLRPSSLLAGINEIAPSELGLAAVTGWPELQMGAKIEEFEDELAPSLTDAEFRNHSTRLLEWQSGCPFRAFAQVRLSAQPPYDTTLGANPIDRGRVTELALQYVWEQFRGLQELEQLTTAQIEHGISSAIERALIEGFLQGEEEWLRQHREIERGRLRNLIDEWLEVERKREPFSNVLHQQEVTVKFGELTIRGRADRIEQTQDGATVIIDYKTGGASYSPSWWEMPRPQDPQLPIYVVAERLEGHDVAGVAFARVKAGKCEFQGEAVRKEIFGKQNHKRYGEYAQTLEGWRPELEKLAEDFLSGHAEVDPKRGPGTSNSTCRYCHLTALCRVAEFAEPPDDDEIEEAADDE